MKKSFEEKKQKELKRNFKFLEKNPWLIKMWKEQERILSDYYKKQYRIEKKYSKIAKKHKIRDIWLASTIDGGTFGIDINNVQAKGEGEDIYLITDSDVERFKESLKSHK